MAGIIFGRILRFYGSVCYYCVLCRLSLNGGCVLKPPGTVNQGVSCFSDAWSSYWRGHSGEAKGHCLELEGGGWLFLSAVPVEFSPKDGSLPSFWLSLRLVDWLAERPTLEMSYPTSALGSMAARWKLNDPACHVKDRRWWCR